MRPLDWVLKRGRERWAKKTIGKIDRIFEKIAGYDDESHIPVVYQDVYKQHDPSMNERLRSELGIAALIESKRFSYPKPYVEKVAKYAIDRILDGMKEYEQPHMLDLLRGNLSSLIVSFESLEDYTFEEASKKDNFEAMHIVFLLTRQKQKYVGKLEQCVCEKTLNVLGSINASFDLRVRILAAFVNMHQMDSAAGLQDIFKIHATKFGRGIVNPKELLPWLSEVSDKANGAEEIKSVREVLAKAEETGLFGSEPLVSIFDEARLSHVEYQRASARYQGAFSVLQARYEALQPAAA